MLKHYLKFSFRNIQKNKALAALNILGLTLGLSACLFILHYVQFEESFDQFHQNTDRIYRLRYERTSNEGTTVQFASCCPAAGPLVRERYPEVEKVGRMLRYRASVSFEEVYFYEDRMYFAETDFLEILPFDFVAGDPLTGISEPNTAFISQSTAHRYFGESDPMGKIFSVDKKTDYKVAGVFEDIPANSHLKFDILLSYKNLVSLYGEDFEKSWGHTGVFTYVQLKPNQDLKALEAKLVELPKAECAWLEEYKMSIDLKMQPLTDIHLNSHYMQEYEANGDKQAVTFLTIIAFFVIVIAWGNYANLATSRSLNRSKEIGLRKTVGASRKQLALQFLVETVIINLFAVACTLLLVEVFQPLFNNFVGMPLTQSVWGSKWIWHSILGLFVVGALVSGFYPMVVLSSFRPAAVLKSYVSTAAKGVNTRKVLVVFQFMMALILLVCTFTIYDQILFMRSQPLGFNMEQTLVFKSPRVRPENQEEKFKNFKGSLLQDPNITGACHVTEVPGRQILWDAGAIHKAGEDDSKGQNYQIVAVDYGFVDMFGLEIVAGRNFDKAFSTDKQGLMLNETAVKWMGFSTAGESVGQQVDYWGEIFTIVGVLKDYHQQSLKQAFEPHIYRFMPTGRDIRGQFAVKVGTQNVRETIQFVNSRYDEYFPGNPFEYFFLDEYFDQQYKADVLFARVFGLFSGMAIFVTCLGILGLSAFNVARRKKEIGVRKVLGASVGRIFYLVTNEYIKWVVLSSLISWPISWFIMNRWLHNFAHHIEIGWWVFALAGAVALVVALLTVSWQATRAAMANPVDSLRYE